MDKFWAGFEKASEDKKKSEPEALARVALIDTVNKTLLMGKRRDNERWTITSGHLDEGESPIDAAVREVKEEAGITITPDQLRSIGKNVAKKDDGKPIHVHGFYVPFSGTTPSASNAHDPDNEISVWRWENLSQGLPGDIAGKLHIPLHKDKVIQFAMQKLQDREQEKAAARRVVLMFQNVKLPKDSLAILPQLREKAFREAPQQYAQNIDKIEERKKRKSKNARSGAGR